MPITCLGPFDGTHTKKIQRENDQNGPTRTATTIIIITPLASMTILGNEPNTRKLAKVATSEITGKTLAQKPKHWIIFDSEGGIYGHLNG